DWRAAVCSPDLYAAVPQPEDPAVAGEQLFAALLAAQLQPGLQVLVVVPGRRVEILAERHADGAVVALVQPHRECEAGRDAVAGERDRGAELPRLAAFAVAAVLAVLHCLHT